MPDLIDRARTNYDKALSLAESISRTRLVSGDLAEYLAVAMIRRP